MSDFNVTIETVNKSTGQVVESQRYAIKVECRACGGSTLRKFIDLGTQPLANSYHAAEEQLPEYPLATNVCFDCWHTQLTVVVPPDELFRNYLYVSGTSLTLRDNFTWFADMATQRVIKDYGAPRPSKRVLDIACNDGSQLDAFKALGWNTYGVDPAQNLVPIAQFKGHNVLCTYWNDVAAMRLGVKFDIIVAQNVFAHTDDILSFLLACKTVMQENTILLIQTSQAKMYENGEFDTIYHEHLSFFNTRSMQSIVTRAGLFLNDVSFSPVHGTSFIFEIGKRDRKKLSVDTQLFAEQAANLYDYQTYDAFGVKAKNTVDSLASYVAGCQDMGAKVIGYGAAAKGMTVLNFGQIGLDYIVDDNPLKQGRYTPGMDIEIKSSDALQTETGPIVIVPLAWNFFDEISDRVKQYVTRPVDFIRYFPTFEVVTK